MEINIGSLTSGIDSYYNYDHQKQNPTYFLLGLCTSMICSLHRIVDGWLIGEFSGELSYCYHIIDYYNPSKVDYTKWIR